jgi:hypothetical protein
MAVFSFSKSHLAFLAFLLCISISALTLSVINYQKQNESNRVPILRSDSGEVLLMGSGDRGLHWVHVNEVGRIISKLGE